VRSSGSAKNAANGREVTPNHSGSTVIRSAASGLKLLRPGGGLRYAFGFGQDHDNSPAAIT